MRPTGVNNELQCSVCKHTVSKVGRVEGLRATRGTTVNTTSQPHGSVSSARGAGRPSDATFVNSTLQKLSRFSASQTKSSGSTPNAPRISRSYFLPMIENTSSQRPLFWAVKIQTAPNARSIPTSSSLNAASKL